MTEEGMKTQRELENLSTRLTRLEADTKEQNLILNEMRDMMIAARGSWKTILAISGIAAAVGGLIVKLLPLWFQKP